MPLKTITRGYHITFWITWLDPHLALAFNPQAEPARCDARGGDRLPSAAEGESGDGAGPPKATKNGWVFTGNDMVNSGSQW